MKRRHIASLATILALSPAIAGAHPHVFIEARLEVVAGDNGQIAELHNVWRFDEVFSSSVLLDFDKNSDLKLDAAELTSIGDTVKQSLADYGYYTNMQENGKEIETAAPEIINVDFKDGQLLMFFAVKPSEPMPLKGTLSYGVYDPTLYTSIDFASDNDMVLIGDAFKSCKHQVVRPDPDQVLAQNQKNLTDAFFNDPAGTDMSKLFATRLEISC